eukprot:scaffold115814_cov36-Phaeocystis_antarctica.AAC.1
MAVSAIQRISAGNGSPASAFISSSPLARSSRLSLGRSRLAVGTEGSPTRDLHVRRLGLGLGLGPWLGLGLGVG